MGNFNANNVGSSFEDFLIEEDLLEETTALALNRVLGWQIAKQTINLGVKFMEGWDDKNLSDGYGIGKEGYGLGEGVGFAKDGIGLG